MIDEVEASDSNDARMAERYHTYHYTQPGQTIYDAQLFEWFRFYDHTGRLAWRIHG